MSDRPTFEMATDCPSCGRQNEAATPPDGGRGPKSGDFSMCISCGEWAIFAAGSPGGMRKPSFEEYAEIVSDPMSRKMREAWVMTKQDRKK